MAMLFARIQADVPVKLRRGAWYRVLKVDDLQVTIEVNRRPVGVLRAWLEIKQRPPQRWGVVDGDKENRRVPPHLRGTDCFCPNCRARAPLPNKAVKALECARCHRVVVPRSPVQRHCPDCTATLRRLQSRRAMARRRHERP